MSYGGNFLPVTHGQKGKWRNVLYVINGQKASKSRFCSNGIEKHLFQNEKCLIRRDGKKCLMDTFDRPKIIPPKSVEF